MATNKFNSINLLPILLSVGFLCIGFIPNWGAVDKIAPQWLTLSILNLLSIIVILRSPSFFSSRIVKVVRTGMASLYIGFFIWAGLSYFYAINPVEVLVNMARHANTVFMYLHLTLFVYGIKNKIAFVSWAMVALLGIEIYAILTEAYAMSQTVEGIVPGQLKGVTANRNIGAFSLAIKMPFVLYLLHNIRKNWLKGLLLILIWMTILGLSIISSRASYVAVALTGVLYLGFVVFQYVKEKKWQDLLRGFYFIIPLVLAIGLNQLILSNSKTVSVLERASTISVSTNDGSVNQRLRYYEDVLTHILANPILGTGIGNWKLVSINYDKNDIKGYVVPYHAHSDFIQIGAELGFLGFFLYLGVFLFAGFGIYKIFHSDRVNINEKNFVFFLLIALGVYSIDANLNFPIARPQVLAPWAMVMALITFYYIKTKSPEEKDSQSNTSWVSYVFGILGILIFIPTLINTNTVYKSHQAQMTILRDFNSNQYNIPLNQIESFVPTTPNITVTTIPMNAIKARYYFHYKKYDQALNQLEKARAQNPYLMYPELLSSHIYTAKGDLQKAKEYAKEAFFNLPNNSLHASNYLQLLINTKDRQGLSQAFEIMTQKDDRNNWKNYLVAVTNIFPAEDELQVARAKEATKVFSGDTEFMQLYKLIALGAQRINDGVNYSNQALAYFNQGNHAQAVVEFEKAIAADPLEFSFRENAATSYYLIDDLNSAIKHIDVVINDLNPLNGKCEYIKALIFLKFGDPDGACPLLRTSKDSGYAQAETTFQQYCTNR